MVRAVRGAITVEENTKDNILDATKELLSEILKDNEIERDDLIPVSYTHLDVYKRQVYVLIVMPTYFSPIEKLEQDAVILPQ